MLGGAFLLASRSEALLAFLLPIGLLPAIRLLSEGDEEHLTMGLLVILFTFATLTTAWRFYRTIESSLTLRFENHDLMEDLQITKNETDALNQQLERRVQARTVEFHQTSESLRAEIKQREQMEEEILRTRKLESLERWPVALRTISTTFSRSSRRVLSWPRCDSLPTRPFERLLSRPPAPASVQYSSHPSC